MPLKARIKHILNVLRYGTGPEARQKKRLKKLKQKEAKFESDRWEQTGDLARRRYDSYDEYVSHQASKLDKVIDRLKRNELAELNEFRERFQLCSALADARSILCLGARLGVEVKALHSLGYFAVGIDLNPGPNNAYVLPGDFHKVVFPDSSVDAIYTNTMDHVFDLQRMIGEVKRLLRPNSLFLVEIEVGFAEGHLPGDYEAIHWRDSEVFTNKICELGGFVLESVTDLGKTRRGQRKLILFRKPV
jgi:SAM-dependent methyltransferase